jgi:hypothetical protein
MLADMNRDTESQHQLPAGAATVAIVFHSGTGTPA